MKHDIKGGEVKYYARNGGGLSVPFGSLSEISKEYFDHLVNCKVGGWSVSGSDKNIVEFFL